MSLRITGNWIKESDLKETVARAWPELEKVLHEEGYVFDEKVSYQNLRGTLSRKNYAIRKYEKGKFITKMKNDLFKSRSEFIGNIKEFNSSRKNCLDTWTMWGGYSHTELAISYLTLQYRNTKKESIEFQIEPKYRKKYHGMPYGTSSVVLDVCEEMERQERDSNKATDASELVIWLRTDSQQEKVNGKLEKKLRKTYRRGRE